MNCHSSRSIANAKFSIKGGLLEAVVVNPLTGIPFRCKSSIMGMPIAFVSTIGDDGVFNAAPFSCVAPIGLKPALVCFTIGRKRNGQKKDTLKNIESCKEFVINVVDEALGEGNRLEPGVGV